MTREMLADLLLINIKGRLTDEIDVQKAEMLYWVDIVSDASILEIYYSSRRDNNLLKQIDNVFLKSEEFTVQEDEEGKYLKIPKVIYLPSNRGIEGVYDNGYKIPQVKGLAEVDGIEEMMRYWWPSIIEGGVKINLWGTCSCKSLKVRYAKALSEYEIDEEIFFPSYVFDRIIDLSMSKYLISKKNTDEINDGV